jgi:hypothetical protein
MIVPIETLIADATQNGKFNLTCWELTNPRRFMASVSYDKTTWIIEHGDTPAAAIRTVVEKAAARNKKPAAKQDDDFEDLLG